MRRLAWIAGFVALAGSLAVAAPLGTSVRNAIPRDVQQIICVDYRMLRASSTALALKNRVLPSNLKAFESAVRGVGLDPDKDVESLTFASFRTNQRLQTVGIAVGAFPVDRIRRQFKAKNVRPTKYRSSWLFPSGAMQLTFLDSYTMMFGDSVAIRSALDARDGEIQSINANGQISDLIASADNGPVWSVLDQSGTQNLMKSALGDASQLADYGMVKKRLLGSRYAMDFNNGMKFDMDVVTSDSLTAGTLSALVKAGMLYRRTTSSGADKLALENMSVDSDSDRLQLHFRVDERNFQSLLRSDLFAAVIK
jgi:hypothetical protein